MSPYWYEQASDGKSSAVAALEQAVAALEQAVELGRSGEDVDATIARAEKIADYLHNVQARLAKLRENEQELIRLRTREHFFESYQRTVNDWLLEAVPRGGRVGKAASDLRDRLPMRLWL